MSGSNLLADAQKARLADDYDTAEKLARAFTAMHPDDLLARSFLGLCKVERGNKAGLAMINEAASNDKAGPMVHLYHSIALEQCNDLRGAVVAASKAATNGPKQFEPWAQLGKLLGLAGRYREAQAALQSAFALNPGHTGIAFLLAGAALEENRVLSR